ncbi:MAG: sugar ABC transporter permease [Chloroflexi bacterium]|nr:sugar ABC transporter permease [Chloroflexota bacterium]
MAAQSMQGQRNHAQGLHAQGLHADRRREERTAWLLLAPYLLMFLAFLVYPSIQGLYMSFTDARLGRAAMPWVGWDNYAYVLTDPLFHRTVLNTLAFVLESTPLLIVIPLLLAVALHRAMPLRAVLRGAFFVPFTLSVSVIGITWWWLLQPQFGLINVYLHEIGIDPPGWFTSGAWAMFAVVLATVWWTAGYNLILFLAGLGAIPVTVYEAAKIDGATWWDEFWYVTLPLLRPTMLLVVVIQVIASFQVFGQVFVITTGGPGDATRTVIQYVYEAAFVNQRMGDGSAAAWVLFVVIMIFSVIQFRFLRGHTEY